LGKPLVKAFILYLKRQMPVSNIVKNVSKGKKMEQGDREGKGEG
jgi:hypothetical protein